MQTILVAVDVLSPHEKTLDFACYLAHVTHSKLTGVFLENLVYADKPVVKSLYGSPYIETIVTTDVPENIGRRKACEMAVNHFNQVCRDKEIEHFIHLDRGIPVDELVDESRFADLIIIDAETSFSKKIEGIPSRFVKDVLADSECPVLISPENFDVVNEIIFAYDGSRSSVYALKLFTYLFPQFADRMIRVVQVSGDENDIITEKKRLKEWLHAHYHKIDMVILHGKPEEELFIYLLNKENMIVVMGAYGRSWLSNLFTKSDANLVVKSIDLPVFIAHS